MSKILIAGVIVSAIIWWQVGFTEALYTAGAFGGLFVASRLFGKQTSGDSSVPAPSERVSQGTTSEIVRKQKLRKEEEDREYLQKVADHAAKISEIEQTLSKVEERKRTARNNKRREQLEDLKLDAEIAQARRMAETGTIGAQFGTRPQGASLFGNAIS